MHSDVSGAGSTAVIGVGNSVRGDDAVGIFVAQELLKSKECEADVFRSDGNVTDLIDIFSRYQKVVLVDAVCLKNKDVGSVLRLEPKDLPGVGLQSSSHSMGVAEAIQLATELKTAPLELVIYGVVGEHFQIGDAMSIQAREAITKVTKLVLNEINKD